MQSRVLAGAIGLVLAAAAVVPTLDAALVAQGGDPTLPKAVQAAAVTSRGAVAPTAEQLLAGLSVRPESHAASYRRSRFGHAARTPRTVSLRQAWVSGAWRWSAARRAAFAADQTGSGPVAAAAAPAIGTLATPCSTATGRIAVKARWHLTVDPAERAALVGLLGGCAHLAVAIPVSPDAATF